MHPTVFDNLKTILEGTLYECESETEIEIVNRQDLIDLANLTRRFIMTIEIGKIYGKVELNFSNEMWTNEVIYDDHDVTTQLKFTFTFKDEHHAIPYLQAYQLVSKSFWNIDFSYKEEDLITSNKHEKRKHLEVMYKEKLGEEDIERFITRLNDMIQFAINLDGKLEGN